MGGYQSRYRLRTTPFPEVCTSTSGDREPIGVEPRGLGDGGSAQRDLIQASHLEAEGDRLRRAQGFVAQGQSSLVAVAPPARKPVTWPPSSTKVIIWPSSGSKKIVSDSGSRVPR